LKKLRKKLITDFNLYGSQEKWQDQFQTNFFSATNITRAILPHFREKKAGKIAIISSVMAWSGALAAGPYTVSKHALDGASI
jgi:NAD(P)-dependent dehydrogenase (short-subunit alcohol dehydrogenase family)